ncbi:MAG: hypothetical protein HQL03_02090 [Nitrospirae bacterium]|nr:hypothetical protein [Nitrospirota bacterium]MBF0591366.1 hypothetical protein [Nitrospirota bacterium]
MNKSYYKQDYDLNRCSVNGLMTITILHRFLSLFRGSFAGNAPNIVHVLTVYVMHRFFYLFHYSYMIRDVLRKIRNKLRLLYVLRIKR